MTFFTIGRNGEWIEKSFEQIIAEEEERKKNRKASFDGKYLTIKYKGNHTYDIPVDRLKTPGQTLDWIHQISAKTWAWEEPQVMRDFLEVLFETIPQEWWSGQ